MIRHRHALSLIEVVLSMSLLSIAVIVLVMALPAALRVQERSRFQLYAAAKGLELVDRLLGEPASNSGPTDGGSNSYDSRRAFTFESAQPWDTPGGRRALDPDLEIRAAIHRGSLVPMPRELAYRIDCADDEIRRILDQGGQLYISNPSSANPLSLDGPLNPRPPSESIRLVVAVQGYAQQNAIQHYPWKDWPYYAAYPSPPTYWKTPPGWNYGFGDERFSIEEFTFWGDNDAYVLYVTNLAKTGTGAFDYDGSNGSGTGNYTGRSWLPDDPGASFNNYLPAEGWLQAKSQLMLALWYGWRKGLPASVLNGQASAADIAACAQDPLKVRALRFLAFAGACMTKWYPLDPEPARAARTFPWNRFWDWAASGPDSTPTAEARPAHDGLRAGIPLPGDDDPAASPGLGRVWPLPPSIVLEDIMAVIGPVGPTSNPFLRGTMPGAPAGHPMLIRSPSACDGQLFVTAAMIANWHEACLGSVMAYAAANPYDWSEPRPFERQLFTDHPLIQWDICSDDLLYGVIKGTPEASVVAQTTARQWRPIAARPITNQGWNRVYTEGDCPMPANDPTTPLREPRSLYSTSAGAAATPTKQDATYGTIKGDESHFNLALPFDPSERCRQMVFFTVDWTAWQDFETAASAPLDAARYPRWNYDYAVEKGANVGNPTAGLSSRMANIAYFDVNMPFMRNPEKNRLFVLDQSTTPTGTAILYHTAGPDGQFDVNQTESSAYVYRNAIGWDDVWRRVDLGHDPGIAALDGVPLPTDHPRRVFSGLYGADRNGNARLDRGPLSASMRLRAVEVGRLNYYDPRLGFTLR